MSTINTIKILTQIGYSNPKSYATKIFGSYECELEKAKQVIKEQSLKKGKFSGEYAKLIDSDLSEFVTTITTDDSPKSTSTFVSDGSSHVTQVRHLVYDNIFVKLAEDKTNGIEYANALIEYLSNLQTGNNK